MLLVDCMGLIYRGHFAMSRNPLRAPDGAVTSGLMYLMGEIYSYLDMYSPGYVLAAFDSPGKGFRSSIYESYKANRPLPPPEMVFQMEMAPGLVRSMGIAEMRREGFEADDIIASAVERAASDGILVDILSSDKDLLQLVGPGVGMVQPARPGARSIPLSASEVEKVLGVPPSKVADYLALAGDSSDNIPGARGIGPKTALALLGEFDGLNDIYAHLDRVSPDSLRARLEASRDLVRMSRELVELRRDALGDFDLEDFRLKAPDPESAPSMLERLGMRKLKSRISGQGIDGTAVQAGGGQIPFPGERDIREEEPGGDARAFVEAWGMRGAGSDLSCEGFAVVTGADAATLPLSDPDSPSRLGDLLAGGFAASSSKGMLHLLRSCGAPDGGPRGDPTLADYLLSSGDPGRTLDQMAAAKGISLPGQGFPGDPSEAVARARSCRRITADLEERLARDAGLDRVYRDIELPLVPVLASMERRGVGLDLARLEEIRGKFLEELRTLEAKASELAGCDVNLNSPAKVSEVLFDRLGLPRIRKTGKGGDSSGYTVLQALAGMHPFVDMVIEHRELSKLVSTYVEKLPGFVSRRTGLIHTSFNQAVTATGRLSSSDPNLQNIPIRTDRGRSIRSCFVPGGEGQVFVSADYSQIELRVLASLAGEGALRRAYENDEDIHSATARAVFGDDSPEHRRRAKEVNFSIVYGISAHGLSQRLSIPRGEAASLINRYFDIYPEIDAFLRRCISEAEATGETRTLTGRRRLFGEFAAARGTQRKALERMVVNTTVQGSAADIVKLAMLKVAGALEAELEGAGLVLQVHDELVATVPRPLAGRAVLIMKESMEMEGLLQVPLKVGTGVGANWLEAGH